MATKLLELMLLAGVWGFQLEPHLSAAQNQTCEKYSCPPADFNMTAGTCAQVVNGITYVQACTPLNSTFCDTTSFKCQTIPPVQTLPSWPGEPCSESRACAYGTCQMGKCKGMFSGAPCSISDQCDPGLRCNSTGLCSSQIPAGSSGCLFENDCVNGADCNATKPSNGTCLAYASVAVGQWVSDCGNGFSRLCKTGFCFQKSLFTRVGTCLDAPKSVVTPPQPCSKDNDCVGANSLNFFISTCSCGFNPTGASYCSPFLGDPAGLAYIAQWVKALTASQGVCNTARRFANGCLNITGQLPATIQASFLYHNYTSIQGNDDCIKKTYTRIYWDLWAEKITLGALALATVVVL